MWTQGIIYYTIPRFSIIIIIIIIIIIFLVKRPNFTPSSIVGPAPAALSTRNYWNIVGEN